MVCIWLPKYNQKGRLWFGNMPIEYKWFCIAHMLMEFLKTFEHICTFVSEDYITLSRKRPLVVSAFEIIRFMFSMMHNLLRKQHMLSNLLCVITKSHSGNYNGPFCRHVSLCKCSVHNAICATILHMKTVLVVTYWRWYSSAWITYKLYQDLFSILNIHYTGTIVCKYMSAIECAFNMFNN